MSTETYISFGLYLLFMIGIGVFFSRKSSASASQYMLGGRGLGSWVTAFSAEASDMSGWLLMGLPGAIYLAGLCETWIALGLFLGTVANWILVARPFRRYSGELGSITMIGFLDDRVKCPKHLIRIIGGIITLFFFLIYSSSGLVAAGKLFESMFDIPYTYAVVIGLCVMLIYILLGGYLAVCWTDFFQGILMFVAIVVLPLYAYFQLDGGCADIAKAFADGNISLSLFPQGKGFWLALAGIISAMAWGLGYFGQPHILVRFMGINDEREVPKATIIATVWVLFSLVGACAVAMVARPYFPGFTSTGDAERVFILLIGKLFTPVLAGLFLSAIMAAIMSTIDSQLLVCSSTVASDLYLAVKRTNPSDKAMLHLSRLSVIVIAILAASLALAPNLSIFNLVTFAWGGFGAAFGPAIIMSLYSRKLSWQALLAGIVAGTVVSLVWKLGLNWSGYMYEIVPGFIANFIFIFIFNAIFPQKDAEVLAAYDKVNQKSCCCCCDKQ